MTISVRDFVAMNGVDQHPRPLGNLAYWWQGRISRSQFWKYFILWVSLYVMIGVVNDKLGGGGSVLAIFLLFSIGPNYATAVRRCHDLDRSGWFALTWWIPLGFRRGTIGNNQFGAGTRWGLFSVADAGSQKAAA